MPQIDWFHSGKRLILQIALFAPTTADNPYLSQRLPGLVDTGATSTGVREDVAQALGLKPKGQRRIETANGYYMATEYLARIGFVCGDYRQPDFVPDQHHPYVLPDDIVMFGLQRGFAQPVLIGMDVLSIGDLHVLRDGTAQFLLP